MEVVENSNVQFCPLYIFYLVGDPYKPAICHHFWDSEPSFAIITKKGDLPN